MMKRLMIPALFFSLLFLFTAPPCAHAGVRIGDCWTDYDGTNYCGGSSGYSSYDYGSYDYSGYAVAGQAIGQALGQAMTGAIEGLADAMAEAIAKEARRKAAWEAARRKYLEKRQQEIDQRNAARNLREQRHQEQLTQAALRMEEIIGSLMTDLGGPAAAFADFEFAGRPAARDTDTASLLRGHNEVTGIDRGFSGSATVDLRGVSGADAVVNPKEMKKDTPPVLTEEDKRIIRERWDQMAQENLHRLRMETLAAEVRKKAQGLLDDRTQEDINELLVQAALSPQSEASDISKMDVENQQIIRARARFLTEAEAEYNALLQKHPAEMTDLELLIFYSGPERKPFENPLDEEIRRRSAVEALFALKWFESEEFKLWLKKQGASPVR